LPDRLPGAVPRADDVPSDLVLRGIAIIATGYAVIACADAAVKWALPEVGVATAMVWRGAFGALGIFLFVGGRGLFPHDLRLITARSVLHCGVTVIWYWVWISGMALADSYAVAAAAPLLMTLLAIPMLGEQVGWRRWTSTAVGFAGVLFMLQPGGDLWRWEALALLGGTAVLAVTRIWTRVLAATDTPAAISFGLLLAHVPLGLALLPAFPAPSLLPPPGVALALVFVGLANGLAHLLFARAFAIAPVSVLAPFEYSVLLWGVLLGFAIWGEVPAWTTIAGAVVVMAAGLYNLHRARQRRSEAAAPRRRRRAAQA